MSDDIQEILNSAIKTKVVEAFNQTPDMIEKLVRAAFEKEVDQYGTKPTGYGAEKMPWIDWLVGDEIRNAAQEAVKDYMAEHKEAVQAKVKSAIENGDFGNQIGDTIARIMADEYRWSFSIGQKPE